MWVQYSSTESRILALFRFKRRSIAAFSISVSVGLSLVGYTALLMIFANLTGGTEGSRFLTIPVRIFVIGTMVLAVLLGGRLNRHPAVFWFLIFSILYFMRIFIEWHEPSFRLYKSPLEFFLYFVSFTLMPLILISCMRLDRFIAEEIRVLLVRMGFVFALLTAAFYGGYVGQASRISQTVGRDAEYISPLSLSYQSALVIGVLIISWISSRTSFVRSAGTLISIFLLTVPFFLGASRGSVVALGLVFLFFLSFWPGVKRRALVTFGSLFLLGLAFALQGYLGDGIFQRVASIGNDIETGSSSVIRLIMWREGFEQFLISPVFGNSLQHEGFQFHPHNIFIEVLISTGILGFVPFSMFLFFVARSSVSVIRESPESSWVVVVFLVGFSSNMFSGSISSAVMFMTGAGLVLATARSCSVISPGDRAP